MDLNNSLGLGYLCGVGQPSPPLNKFHISSLLLHNAKNIVLPEAEMAKHLLIGVGQHFQRGRTVSKNSDNADFSVSSTLQSPTS